MGKDVQELQPKKPLLVGLLLKISQQACCSSRKDFCDFSGLHVLDTDDYLGLKDASCALLFIIVYCAAAKIIKSSQYNEFIKYLTLIIRIISLILS